MSTVHSVVLRFARRSQRPFPRATSAQAVHQLSSTVAGLLNVVGAIVSAETVARVARYDSAVGRGLGLAVAESVAIDVQVGGAGASGRHVRAADGSTARRRRTSTAEQSVLGGMMLSKDAIADVVEVLRPGDFYRPAHQPVYDAILDLYGRGEPADPVTVAAELTSSGELARVGGAPYLHTLISVVPTAANAGYYAEIVAEQAVLRRLVEAGTRIVQLGYSGADGDGTSTRSSTAPRPRSTRSPSGATSEDYVRARGPAAAHHRRDRRDRLARRRRRRACPPASPTSTSSPTACIPAR